MDKPMKVLLYGYGGHARVLTDCLEALGCAITGVFDDKPLTNCPYSFLGTYNPSLQKEVPILLAIGNNRVRRKLSQLMAHPAGKAVHPSALLSPQSRVGEGTVLLHRAVVQAAASLGRHVIINSGAIVEHDCRLADFVHIAPGAILCGGVEVGEGSLIGAGAVVLPGISIGKDCVVGAGAVVHRSVADGQQVAGNPARII